MIQLIIILFFALLVAIITYVIYKFIVVTRVKISDSPRILVAGHSPSANISINEIPRIIWTYWREPSNPPIVERCQENWQRIAPDHEIRALNKNNFSQWISPDSIPDYFHHLPPYRQADWLRLQLLAKYGGIWVDASIILTQDLHWVHETQQREKSEYVGFYIHMFTANPKKPIIENWFMAAIPNSKFIADLANEFNRAITMGEAAYLAELTDQERFNDVIQLISPKKLHTYLIMHVAASALLEKDAEKYRLALFCAEDTAFAFHSLLNWSKRTLYFKLALTPCPKNLPFIIKLRGGERDRAEKQLAKGLYYRGSLFAKFLKL